MASSPQYHRVREGADEDVEAVAGPRQRRLHPVALLEATAGRLEPARGAHGLSDARCAFPVHRACAPPRRDRRPRNGASARVSMLTAGIAGDAGGHRRGADPGGGRGRRTSGSLDREAESRAASEARRRTATASRGRRSPGDEIGLPSPRAQRKEARSRRASNRAPRGGPHRHAEAVGVDHETRHPRLGGDGAVVDLVAEIVSMALDQSIHVAQAEPPATSAREASYRGRPRRGCNCCKPAITTSPARDLRLGAVGMSEMCGVSDARHDRRAAAWQKLSAAGTTPRPAAYSAVEILGHRTRHDHL
jgi:hypothetical protein